MPRGTLVPMWIWMVGLSLAAPPPTTITLERGANGYWANEDTTLESENSAFAAGGNAILEGGPGKTVLFQFKDLNHALGPNRRITKAKLVFALGRGEAKFTSIRRVLQPWTEGPFNSISQDIRSSRRASRWAATWTNRRGGIDAEPWKLPGARSEEDAAPIPEAKASVTADLNLVIEGLESAVQLQYDRWYDNNGFVMEFAEPIELLSSNASELRPKLVVETEAGDPPKGPDLSVVAITRTPEYPRYSPEFDVVNGIAAPKPPTGALMSTKRWPADGEMLTYEATIKNVGDAPTGTFDYQWRPQERPGPIATETKPLAPGESVKVTFQLAYRGQHSDHRTTPVSIRLFPKAADARADNNFLEIQQSALAIRVGVEKSVAEKLGPAWEERFQTVMRRFNEVYLNYSRYSFAPEGAVERLRVHSFTLLDKDATLPASDLPDADWVVREGDSLDEEEWMRSLAKASGLIDFRSALFPDPQPGLLGGDTRSDLPLISRFRLLFTPDPEPVIDSLVLDRYLLMSATDVGALNENTGRRRGYVGDHLYDLPDNVMVAAFDRNGKPLANVELTFYQTENRKPSTRPTFKATTNASGIINLPNRPVGAGPVPQTATGHTLKANLFGRIDMSGSNGEFQVETTVNGVRDVQWIKIWQLVQNFYRGQSDFSNLVLRFNVPGAPLGETALTGPATASAESVLVDLGKEITLGEVRIWASQIWNRFEIQTKGESGDFARFTQENQFDWSLRVRSTDGAAIYRGLAEKVRFIRLVPRGGSTGTPAGVKIEAIATKG
jgi:hypothetical protein